MRFKYLVPLAACLTLSSAPLAQAGEKEFAALFVRAHHDYADYGATKAIATLDQALKEADNQASIDLANTFLFAILKNEGRTFSEDIMSAQTALTMLSRAVAMRPNDPFVRMHLGATYCTLEQYKKCEASLTEAINVAQGEEKARYYSSRALYYHVPMGRADLSIQDHSTARNLYLKYGNQEMADVEEDAIKLMSAGTQ